MEKNNIIKSAISSIKTKTSVRMVLAVALAVALASNPFGGGKGGKGMDADSGAAYGADTSAIADHVIRVHLSSLGAPASINATVTGAYTVGGSGTAVSGAVTIAASGTSGISLTAGGTSYALGKDVLLKSPDMKVSSYISLGGRNYSGDLRVINKGGALKLVSHVDIETYVMGVVPYESGNSSSYMEALKAQAVAVRTFAHFFMNSRNRASQEHDIVNTTAAQVYNGYNSSYGNANAAVAATSCQILQTPSGGTVLTCYSAANGGYTEYPKSAGVTITNFPYLPYREDPYDLAYSLSHPEYSAALTIPKSLKVSDLKKKGAQPYAMLRSAMRSAGADPAKLPSKSKVSVKKIVLTHPRYDDNGSPRAYTGANFTLKIPKSGKKPARTITVKFGPYTDANGVSRPFLNDKLGLANKSKFSMLYLRGDSDSYLMASVRFGHSAGLSQVGAYQMATEGISYKGILNFYYLAGSETQLIAKDWPIDNGVVKGPAPVGDDPIPVIGTDRPPDEKKSVYPFKAKVKIDSGSLTVRSGPGNKYKKVGAIKNNHKITIKGAKGSWYRISYKGKKAYVAKRYVKKIK
ncbi:MAG: SpoIID/LytB domain-containing protein [Clostridiales Family XIII bacterium]|jgi:stage II sporulation protein D|nr:SpoIID/LytB domain-containing protein [Clostridiales Family XIII bacterium]